MAKKRFKINLVKKKQRILFIGILSIVILSLAVFAFLTFFSKNYNSFEGNSPSNIVNTGIASHENGFLYYSKFDNGYKIFKLNLKTKTEKAIYEDNAKYINVYEDFLYYIRGSNGNIIKLGTNGSKALVLNDSICSNLYVTKDWIYYIDKLANNTIHRINMKTHKSTLLVDMNASSLIVYKNFLYFVDLSDNNSLYRYNMDTQEISLLVNSHIIFYTITEDIIFYTNASDGSFIYKADLDGSNNSKLDGTRGWYLSSDPSNSKIVYFKSTKGNMRRFNINTLNQMTITNDDCYYINSFGKYIIYMSEDMNGYYLLDSSNGEKIKLR